ncbi:MAG: hypothetical protein ACFFCZ_23850 [Promethearchaeota archaeon]
MSSIINQQKLYVQKVSILNRGELPPPRLFRRQCMLERSGLPCSSTLLAEARLVSMEIRFVLLTSVEVCISKGVTSLSPVGTMMNHYIMVSQPVLEDVKSAPVIITSSLFTKIISSEGQVIQTIIRNVGQFIYALNSTSNIASER